MKKLLFILALGVLSVHAVQVFGDDMEKEEIPSTDYNKEVPDDTPEVLKKETMTEELSE